MTVTIEFVGPPAAGKTKLSKAVASNLSNDISCVYEPSRTISQKSRYNRIITKSKNVIRQIYNSPLTSIDATGHVIRTDQPTVSDTIKVLFNYLYICGINRGETGDVILFDQGVFQALWSIGYKSKLGWDFVLQSLTLPAAVLPDLVVIVTADKMTLKKRLGSDHHSRTRVSESEMDDICRAREGIHSLQELLDEYASVMRGNGYTIHDNSENTDFNRTVSRITSEIQELAKKDS